MKKKGLFWFLLPSYWIITIASIAIISIYVFNSMSNLYYKQVEEDILTRAKLLSESLRNSTIINEYRIINNENVDKLCIELGGASKTRFTVVLPDGQAIGDTDATPSLMKPHNDRIEVINALEGRIGKDRRRSSTTNREYQYVAIPLFDDNNQVICAVRAAIEVTGIQNEVGPMTTRVFVAAIIISLASMYVCVIATRRITNPLGIITHTAKKITEGDFEEKIPEQNTEELNQLSDSLNQMLEKINQQKSEQSTILESMNDGVMAIDNDGKIIIVNPQARNILGIEGKKTQKKDYEKLIENKKIKMIIFSLLNEKKSIADEILIKNGDSSKVILFSGTLLLNSYKQSIGSLFVLRDITHLRFLEKVKTNFVANVSHELKTPVTAIQGFVETLLSSEFNHNQDARNFLDIIKQQSGRLDAIIDDLLMLSRLEQTDVKVFVKDKNILNVINSSINLVQLLLNEKKVNLNVECNKELHWNINSSLIEHALVNLITNSIKYSDSYVNIDIKAKKYKNNLRISIIDNGFGIEKNDIPRLFERFYRSSSGRITDKKGTGLGLSIVKHIVQVHSGIINIDSKVGIGTTFKITIPFLEPT